MSGTKGMLHGEVESVTKSLEISPSKTQACSSLSSAHGNLEKGTAKAKGGKSAAKKHTGGKLGSAMSM
jgi:hypothetical protein